MEKIDMKSGLLKNCLECDFAKLMTEFQKDSEDSDTD